MLLAADYGDAPDTYGTSIAAGGAYHSSTNWFLGTTFDMEHDGAPTAFADGDGADDDGVTFHPLRVGGEATVSVFVTLQPTSGAPPLKLDAWIDFDGDGTFSGANERIATSALVLPGSNLISFNVPADAAFGTTYARFRLTSTTYSSTIGPRGDGGPGEVEDYAVQILPPNASSAPFVEQLIVNGNRGSGSLHAVDMDRDGDLDLLSHDFSQGTVVWHANMGNGSFVQQKTDRTFLGLGTRVTAGDFNVDGGIDVLVVSSGSARWIWKSQFTPGTYLQTTSLPANAAIAIDAMKDGRLDVATAAQPPQLFRLYNNDLNSNLVQNIATGTVIGTAIDAADIDGDGDIDFVGGTDGDDTLAWYEYLGPAGGYARRVISTEVVGVRSAMLVDLDGDDDLDVLTYSIDGEIEWFENNGAQSFARHLIATIAGVHELNHVDVDGDGDLDVLVAAGLAGAKLLTNDGQQTFTESALPVNANVPIRTIAAGDFDGDGILEIALGGHDYPPSGSGYLALLRRGAELDFGDAPASYGTTRAADGARHYPAGPTLGAARDSEADGGSPTSADDVDEDGVTLGFLQAGDFNATTVVNVQNAPNGARLDAWIDFDGDGTFSGANERIATSLSVVEGNNTLSFAIPATAARYTYARFRLSSNGGLGPRGGAADGEVEDYEISIQPADAGSGLFGERKQIATDAFDLLATADLDQDGDVDFLTASTSNLIYWHVNNGQGDFQRRTIYGTGAGTPESLDVVDLNGDSRLDLLVKTSSTLYAMYQLEDATFLTSVLSTNVFQSLTPTIVDLDQDGNVDVVLPLRYAGSGTLQLFLNAGHGQFVSRTVTLSAAGQFPYSVTAIAVSDADGDGDLDIYVAPDSSMLSISLYRNDGQENFSFASSYSLQGVTSGVVRDMRPDDLDDDGDMDLMVTTRMSGVVSFPTGRDFFVLDNQGDGSLKARPVDAGLGEFRSVSVVDLDSDGDRDFVVTLVPGGRVVWYDNIGNGDFNVRQLSPTTSFSSNEVAQHAIADVDGDGTLDLIWGTRFNGGLSWLKQITEPLYDYGDAPFPYPVQAKDNGARHTATGPRLGAGRDEEQTPRGAAADGDDGVTIASFRVAQRGGTAIVHVENAPAGAKLDAWIDFDGDGNWSRAEERIAVSLAVVEGENVVTFDVPAWAQAGASYARFRISTAGGLGYAGTAADGEIEDHPVIILPPTAATGPYFERHLVDGETLGTYVRATLPVDLDQDGDQDIVVSLGVLPGLIWFENDGAGGFARRELSGGGGIVDAFLAAGDVDLDGDLDLLAYPVTGSHLLWLINDGTLNFTAQAVNAGGRLGSGPQMALVDLEGDGDVDYLGANVYLPNLANPLPNSARVFAQSYNSWQTVVADLDRNGVLDFVQRLTTTFTNPTSLTFAAYEYVLGQFRGPEILTTINVPASPYPQELQQATAADLDHDGDLDLIVSGYFNGDNVFWFENDGRQNYTQRTIGGHATYSWAGLHAADMDGDGDPDIVASTSSETLWFENDGEQNFTKHVAIDGGGVTSIADMNGDGKLDVLVYDKNRGDNSGRRGLSWYSLTDRQLSVTSSPATANEASGDGIVFAFKRSGNLTGEITVPFAVGGTATFGVDYAVTGAASFDATSGTVTFADGVDVVEVIVTPIDDAVKELNEAVTLKIQPLAGHSIAASLATATIVTEELAGDYNNDGIVDGADFLAWQRGFGSAANPIGSDADGDLDGEIDGDDLAVWKSNFGQTTPVAPPAEAAAVVESAASSFIVAALVAEEEQPSTFEVDTARVTHSGALPSQPWYGALTRDRGGILAASLESRSSTASNRSLTRKCDAVDAAFAGMQGWAPRRSLVSTPTVHASAPRSVATDSADDSADDEGGFGELAREFAAEFSVAE